jgi:hypothetical protein
MSSCSLRRALLALGSPAFLFATQATAQTPSPLPMSSASVRPISGSIRDGGTYHVASGTWTRRSSAISLGNDILYNNTCNAMYFDSLSGDTFVDEGRIPNAASPTSLGSRPGCAATYAIDGFQIGYCTNQPNAALTYAFFDLHTACTSVVGATPAGSFALAGLPGSASTGLVCWTVNVDVASSPFTLTGSNGQPLFGFSMSSPQAGANQGPLLAGDPSVCSRFDGTSFDDTLNLSEAGTGMSSTNNFYIEGGATSPGCYFFNGAPLSSFWLELYGTTCARDAVGQASFCSPAQPFGTAACPCGNNPPAWSGGGCLNSTGAAAQLVGTGTASVSGDTVALLGTLMPANSSVLYFQGRNRFNGGVGAAFGDGLRCAGGQVTRLGTTTNSAAGASQYPSGAQPSVSVRGGVIMPGMRTYQAWYRNAASFCTPATFNTSNGWEIYWGA